MVSNIIAFISFSNQEKSMTYDTAIREEQIAFTPKAPQRLIQSQIGSAERHLLTTAGDGSGTRE